MARTLQTAQQVLLMQIQILQQEKTLQETGSPLFGFLGAPWKLKNRLLPSFCTSSAVTSMSSTYHVSFTSLDLPKLSSTCYKLVLHFFPQQLISFSCHEQTYKPWTNTDSAVRASTLHPDVHTTRRTMVYFPKSAAKEMYKACIWSQSVCILEIEQTPKTTASLCHVTSLCWLFSAQSSIIIHLRNLKTCRDPTIATENMQRIPENGMP